MFSLSSLCLPLLRAAALVGLVGLTACADMSKTECANADWRELGYEDAMSGQTLARFGRRSEACRKNGLSSDRAQYEAGHAQGRIGYCTVARGQSEGAAGQVPAAVCTADASGTPYRQGHAEGLLQFCTAPSGYEYGRKGLNDNQLCPPALAPAFQVGFRMGREWYDLSQRLEDIQKQASDERAVLADAKTPQDRRDAANRHLGQLDADEASTRRLIRGTELAALALTRASAGGPVPAPVPAPSPIFVPEPPPVPAPPSRVSADGLPGQWRLSSVSFNAPVDLNQDGVKSNDGLSELPACQRDRQLDLDGDQRAVIRTGARTPGCKPSTRNYRWRTQEGTRQDVRQEGPRRISTERPALYLHLQGSQGSRNDEPPVMVVEDVDDIYLIVRTDVPDSALVLREAVVTYRRVGR